MIQNFYGFSALKEHFLFFQKSFEGFLFMKTVTLGRHNIKQESRFHLFFQVLNVAFICALAV